MNRGPKPKSPELLCDWRRKQREKDVAAIPEGKALVSPDPPSWMSHGARRIWDILIPLLEAQSTATLIDAMALARYCQMFSQWVELTQYIDSQGGRVEVPRSVIVDEQAVAKNLLAMEREFGMTASARTSIKLYVAPNAGSEVDPREKLFAQ